MGEPLATDQIATEDDDIIIEWNPVMVEQAIYKAAKRISKGVMMADQAFRNFKEAEHNFDIVEAKCYVGLVGVPANAKKYHVVLDEGVQAARDALIVAEAVYKKMDRNMKAIQGELDAYRSIGTSVRQAYQTAGTGER
jgi:hypothetical protein